MKQTNQSQITSPRADNDPASKPLHDPADDIATRAYHKYLNRGCEEGHHCEDWLASEREILAETSEIPT